MTQPEANAARDELAGWHVAGAVDEIEVDGAIVIQVKPRVAVFRLGDGFFATDDTCTHALSSLAEGYIEDGTVECEFHFAKFDIRTGKALTPPAVTPLVTYPVAVRDGIVYVDLHGRIGCPIEQLSSKELTQVITLTEIEAAYALGAPEGHLVPATGDAALWVAELGAGKPTVFLHGGGPGCTSWTDYAPAVPLFAADRRVLLVDMLNYGFSAASPISGPRWTAHAQRIAAVLENLGVTGADFICNSVGGSAAIALAADYPHLVRKMVITGSEPVTQGRAARTPEFSLEGQTAWANYYGGAGPSPEKIVPIMARLEYWDPANVKPDMVQLRYLYSLSPGQRLLGEHPDAFGDKEDLAAKLATVQARILFLYGKQDVFVQDSYPVLLSDIAPYGDVYLMDQAAHHMEEERPADFAAAVKGFLDSATVNG